MTELLLAAFGLVLAAPFLAFPPDPHVAYWSMWSLHRKPGERIPMQLVLNNQGFSRIYMFLLCVALRRLFGNRAFLEKARLLQALALGGCAAMIFCAARAGLGLGYWPSLLGGLLFLLTITRPQFDFMAMNAEPFHVLASGTALVLMLTGLPEGAWGQVAFGFFLLSFSAINAKIVFLAEPLLVLPVVALNASQPWVCAAWSALGIALGLACFVALFRRYLAREALHSLLFYAKWAASLRAGSNYRYLYDAFLSKTPLAGLALLALGGVPSALGSPGGRVVAGWLLAQGVTLFAQQRLALYHVQIVLPSLALASCLALQALLDLHPLALAAGLAAFCVLSRRALADLPAYYRAQPMEQRIQRAFGDAARHFYDLRLPELARHHQAAPGPFIPWGNANQLYYITGQRPYSHAPLFESWGHLLYPGHQDVLIDALREVPHPYIYDLNFRERGWDSFNPLTVYEGTGVRYAPVERRLNVTFYARLDFDPAHAPRRSMHFYLRATPSLDLLHQELAALGLGPDHGPGAWPHDVLDMALWLLRGPAAPALAEPDWLDRLPRDLGRHHIAQLYAAAAHLAAGRAGQARQWLALWQAPHNPYPAMWPELRLAAWCLELLLGGEPGPLPLEPDIMNRLPLYAAFRMGRALAALGADPAIPAPEAQAAGRMLDDLRLNDTPYRDDESHQRLQGLLALRGTGVRPEGLEGRILVVRMAPTEMLRQCVRALEGGGPAKELHLLIQAGGAESARALADFASVATLPDGPFRLGPSLKLRGEDLPQRRYAACVLVIRHMGEANVPDILRLLGRVRADSFWACTEQSALTGLLERIEPLRD